MKTGRLKASPYSSASASLAIYAGEGERREGPAAVGSVPAGATSDYGM